MNPKNAILPLLAAAAFHLTAVAAPNWVNSGQGDWTDTSNWDSGTLPGDWSLAAIDNGGTAVVDNDAYANFYELDVGNYGTGHLILNSGTVNGTWFVVIAKEVGSNGTVTVNGGQLINGHDNNFTVGKGGTGLLTINNDGKVSSDWTFLGGEVSRSNPYGSGSGTIVLNDNSLLESTSGIVVGSNVGGSGVIEINDNSRMTTNGALYIGYNGTAEITVNGGIVSTPNNVTWVGTFAGSSGTLNLNGGVFETNQLKGYEGTSVVTFDGGTLRALANTTNFIGSIGTIELKSGGGTIDTNGKNVTANSAFSGTGRLTKINSGTLTLNASSTIGALSHEAGTIAIAANRTINVDNITTLNGGSILQFAEGAGLNTGQLILQDSSHIVLNPLVSGLHAGVLDLENLSGGKVVISLLDFQGLGLGETLEIFTLDSMSGDYGTDFDAETYFVLENGNEGKYHFTWSGDNKALLLTAGTQIPEPSTYGLIAGAGLIGLVSMVRRKKKH